jgi:hypothetical protein
VNVPQRFLTMKALAITALGVGVVALVVGASAFALEKSLPYRIGPDNYTRYLWAGRFSITALIACLLAMGLGIASRERLPIVFGACSILVLISVPNRLHSVTHPELWCYFNLRRIDAAKGWLAHEKSMTNGTVVTTEELSPRIEGGFRSLECNEHGVYIVGPVGMEPRCSVHGTGDTPRKAQ